MPLVEKISNADFGVLVWEITETEFFFQERISFRSNLNNPSKTLQQMASRYLLELLHPSFPFQQVISNNSGKLLLQDSVSDFSLTHTVQFAAAIMSGNHKVGIDIEKIDARVLKVDRKFLNQNELYWISKLDFDSRVKYTTLCWAIKEAVFKWWGAGGVDFANHIKIHNPGILDHGSVLVDFTKASLLTLHVKFKLIGNHWLAYLVAKHP